MMKEETRMLREKNGKLSSKRVWGTIMLSLACIMTVAGGFDVYNPVEGLVTMMFITGAGLLGIGTFKKDESIIKSD